MCVNACVHVVHGAAPFVVGCVYSTCMHAVLLGKYVCGIGVCVYIVHVCMSSTVRHQGFVGCYSTCMHAYICMVFLRVGKRERECVYFWGVLGVCVAYMS